MAADFVDRARNEPASRFTYRLEAAVFWALSVNRHAGMDSPIPGHNCGRVEYDSRSMENRYSDVSKAANSEVILGYNVRTRAGIAPNVKPSEEF